MKKIFMSAAMLAFLAASCTNEELVQEQMMSSGQPFTLSAEHGMASRTVLNGNQTLWSEGDQIYVSSADGSVYGILTLKKGANSNSAEFFGYISGDASKLAYTIFPAPKSGNKIDLSNRDASNGELDAPMIATFGSNKSSVTFKNETALIKQTISGLYGQTVALSGNGIGGQLKPMLINGQWELVSTGGSADKITITGATDGTLFIPIATSANQEDKAEDQVIKEGITLTCTISEPDGGTSVSTTYTVDVENGKATETNVPKFEYEESQPVEDTNGILKGGNITLSEDLVLTSPLIITQTTTLDLAGHSITNNGPLTAALNATSVDALIVVRPGATLTINDSKGTGKIAANDILCGIKLTDKNDESNADNEPAKLIVNGGTIHGKSFGISGNGNRNRGNTEVVVNGGNITSEATAIFQPQNGTTTITGGSISGVSAAMEIRSGNLNISGGTFTAKSTSFSTTASGNGYTVTGAALAISQHTTNHPINVNINGGTFAGKYALYEEDLADDETNVTISVTGGIFNGPVYSENCEKFIYGCAFTEGSVFDYIADEVRLQMVQNVTLQIGAKQEEYYFGTASTKSITIEGYKNTLTFNHKNSDWNYIRCVNDNAKWIICDANLTNSGHNNSSRGRHNINFYNDVELLNVNSDKSITLYKGGKLTNVNISDVHPTNSDCYGLWIRPKGQTVDVVGGSIIAHESKTGDRGITINNEDLKEGEVDDVTLNISGTQFITQKKGAIHVKYNKEDCCDYKVFVNIEDIDITGVAYDKVNAVSIDKDSADKYDDVIVTGGDKIQEPKTN